MTRRAELETTLTCRLRLVTVAGEELVTVADLGRVTHEAPPGEWFVALPDDVEEGEEWLVVELWEESARWRWLLDERTVTREIADALLEDELAGLLEAAGVAPV